MQQLPLRVSQGRAYSTTVATFYGCDRVVYKIIIVYANLCQDSVYQNY